MPVMAKILITMILLNKEIIIILQKLHSQFVNNEELKQVRV